MKFKMFENKIIDPSVFVSELTSKEILEIKKGWLDKEGQGNKEAREKKFYCVVVKCDEKDALKLSALFYYNFAIRSCCYFKNNKLSLYCGYCGDAGHGMNDLMDRIKSTIVGYFSK